MALHLVTGGAGFIGSNLVSALAASGDSVRILDNLSTGDWDNLHAVPTDARLECIEGDVRNADDLARACAGVDVVFHHAAMGSVPLSIDDPAEAHSINCTGTLQLLQAARRCGVRRAILASSSAIYGDEPTLPKLESMPPAPLSPYAVSKLAAEHYMSVFARLYELETVSLRYFNVFGPGQSPEGPYAAAIPRFLTAALRGAPLTIYGDGLSSRDFCYVDNVVQANLQAATSRARFAGEVLNIASGQRVTLNELVGHVARVLGTAPSVQHTAPRPGDVRHSQADITRAHTRLGYEPSVDWRDGLAPTVEYLRRRARQRGGPCGA